MGIFSKDVKCISYEIQKFNIRLLDCFTLIAESVSAQSGVPKRHSCKWNVNSIQVCIQYKREAPFFIQNSSMYILCVAIRFRSNKIQIWNAAF